MAPGLISEGGKLCENLDLNAAVAVHAEGKQHAICIGVTTMTSDSI